MKILMVTPRFPPDIGGIENVVLNVAEGLVKRGHEVYVLTTTKDRKGVGISNLNGTMVERVFAFSPGNAYWFSTKLGKRVKKLASDFDIIHAHGYHAFPAINAFFNKKDSKFVLSTYYHRNSHSWFRNLLLAPYRIIARRMVNGSDLVICISEAEKRLLFLDFEPANCSVIHVGTEIDDSEIPDMKRSNVIMVGRLEKYKNFDVGIEAVSKIDDLYMDIIGSGPEIDSLKDLVRLRGVTERVKFHGFLSEMEKNRKLAESMCLLTLSDYESFGIVIIEAARSRVWTIASDIPSHSEIASVLEEGVLLVNNSEVGEIVDSIEAVRMMESIDFRPKTERFGWDYLIDKYIENYSAILSSG
jgi:glycosyltransferase involved in cell wall biosynthesis